MIQHVGKSVIPGTSRADVMVTRALSLGYYLHSRKFQLFGRACGSAAITSRAQQTTGRQLPIFIAPLPRGTLSPTRYLAAELICFTGSTLKRCEGAPHLCVNKQKRLRSFSGDRCALPGAFA